MFGFVFAGAKARIHLKAMHSAAGTRVFKKLDPKTQGRWSSYDRRNSRFSMAKTGGHAKVVKF